MSGSDGAYFENVALDHLREAGLVPLARNFNCRFGELDLILRDGEVVVFVEVRYRRGAAAGAAGFGGGVDSISRAKRERLLRAAQMFLADQPRLARQPCRFDVVAISGARDAPRLQWLQNAFDSA